MHETIEAYTPIMNITKKYPFVAWDASDPVVHEKTKKPMSMMLIEVMAAFHLYMSIPAATNNRALMSPTKQIKLF